MNDKCMAVLEEIVARCRRIETRQTKISLAAGFDPTGGKARLKQIVRIPPTFEVSGLDISLADILTGFRTSGISGRVYLSYQGEGIATIEVPEVPFQGEVA